MTRLLFSALLLAAASALAAERFFDSNGVRIRYVDQGSGPPLVLLHGFTGRLESWSEAGVLQELAQDHRVVAPDLRGHGESGKPHEPQAYREIHLDVVRLLDHLGIERAHLVGYSLGGIIAVKLIAAHPQRFASATLAGASWRRHGEPAQMDPRVPYRELVLSTAPTDEPLAAGEIEARSAAIELRNDVRAHAALLRARDALVVSDAEIAAIRVPALAVIGSADPMLATLEARRRRWPSLEMVVVEGATHPMAHARSLARRRELVAAVRAFVRRSSAPATDRPGR